MKKLVLLVAVVAIGIAVPVAVGASTPKLTGGGGSPGAVYNGFTPFNLNVTAQGTTPDVKGNVMFSRADGTFAGPVTCYSQSGNMGTATGPVTKGDGIFSAWPGSMYYVIVVQDNGQGGTATAPDMVQVDASPTPIDCTTYTSSLPYEITTGNFQIH